MDYEAIVHALVDSIVEDPSNIFVRVSEEDKNDITITIATNPEDIARLIGRKGIVANSLREVISVAGKSSNKHVHLRLESFDEEIKED